MVALLDQLQTVFTIHSGIPYPSFASATERIIVIIIIIIIISDMKQLYHTSGDVSL